MVKKPLPRLSKKKTGEMSLKDGKFKLEMKERWRFWTTVATFFGFVFIIVVLIIPWIIAGLAMTYAVMFIIYTKAWRTITYVKQKVISGVKWVGKWLILQPIADFRYGRKRRKEMEESKVYAK